MNLLNEDEVRTINISRIIDHSDEFVYGVIDVFLFARNGMLNEVNMKAKEAFANFQRVYAYNGVYPSSDLIYESLIGFNKDNTNDVAVIVENHASSLVALTKINVSGEDINLATKFLKLITGYVSDRLSEVGSMSLVYFIHMINITYNELVTNDVVTL